MKRKLALFIFCFVLCFALSSLAVPKKIPDFCKPILEAWDATTEEELQDAILTYWEKKQPKGWPTLHKNAKKPVSFWFGGTTKELIKNHKNWDIAIVSSKDVDLQKLADAGVIFRDNWGSPRKPEALNQWLWPSSVQAKLPEHPLFYYHIYCYSYDADTDEAIFLLCNEKGRPIRWFNHWAAQILERRSVDQIREVEGICRLEDWNRFDMPELAMTEAALTTHPQSWDWAILWIDKDYKLEKLDAAGLLYDFSQHEYWANRKPEWELPTALYTSDSRMIAIPFSTDFNDSQKISVFVVNAKSPCLSRALAYSEHFIKSYEWASYGKFTYASDPAEVKKYFHSYTPDSFGMLLKKDITW